MEEEASYTVNIIDKIGEGTYGSVYKAKLINRETGDERVCAVKTIETNKNGITSLMEASIMSTYKHPNLSSSFLFYSDEKLLYIYYDLELTDTLQYIYEPENYVNFNDHAKRIKLWSHQLLQGLRSLHDNGIIHCDIKPNNILISHEGNVKLTDFSFSVIKTKKDDKFDFPIGSVTYSSPQVLQKLKWDEKVDLWSLGCTLYEIATGTYLIPMQSEDKKLNRKYLVSCIRAWRIEMKDDSVPVKSPIVKHIESIAMSPNFYLIDEMLQEIILNMTNYSADSRKSCAKLMNNKYYSGMKVVPVIIKSGKLPKKSKKIDKELAKIDNFFYDLNFGDNDVIRLTKEIALRCSDVENCPIKYETCFWIAHKLLNKYPPPCDLNCLKKDIIECERKICDFRGYKLHQSSPEDSSYISQQKHKSLYVL